MENIKQKLTDKEKEFIIKNRLKEFPNEIARKINRDPMTIKNFLWRHSLQFKHKESGKKYNEIYFTNRELEVFDLLAKGYSFKDIAKKLIIALSTVTTHVPNIYAKIQGSVEKEYGLGITRVKAMLWYFKYVKNIDLERL